ncbi:MAG: DUF115 domain-containing protein [Treponema sp.]|nr:DUF115 domain-containing protein [Treponema sp.]
MNANFSVARNGLLTYSINNIYLHSSYNPIKEAERFVNSIEYNFIPEMIIITEPGISYCADFFRQRFPNTQLIAIRYSNDFIKFDSLFDYVIYNIEKLDSIINENNFSRILFLSWKPSEKIFEKKHFETWNRIKKIVNFSRDILGTKNFFNQRWIKNIFIFCSSDLKTFSLNEIFKPIIIIASGPSLKNNLHNLNKYRENFFLIAVSSSVNTLIYHNIIPDLCISTDGGYWAKKHVQMIKNIPIAISAESAIPKKTLSNCSIVPLTYNDGIEYDILSRCNINCLQTKRNGTVSGTAVELALNLTKQNVGIIGLDLTSSKSFQHTQPNELEKINSQSDYRISNLPTRLINSEKNSGSLDIYASWFKNQNKDFYKRFYRIIENNISKIDLSPLRDIDFEQFLNINNSHKFNLNNENYFFKTSCLEKKQRCNILLDYLSYAKNEIEKNNLLTESTYLLLEQIATAEYVLYKKYNEKKYFENMKSKSIKFIEKLIFMVKQNAK